jgi:hypothetical protein
VSVKRLGIDVPLLVLILAARGFEETTLLQQANGLPREAIEEKTKLISGESRSGKKIQVARGSLMVDAIEHQKMKMGMKIRAAAETLDEKNTSREGARQVRKEAPIVAQDGAAGDGDDCVEEFTTMGDPESKRDGKRQYPLTQFAGGQNVLLKILLGLNHPLAATGRTKTAFFAGQRQETRDATIVAT